MHDHFQRKSSLPCPQTFLIPGTLFQSAHLGLTVWFLAIDLIGEAKTGLSALTLKRALGVSDPTAWLIQHKLIQAMVERDRTGTLVGDVQVDAADLGGELTDGTAGRGSENKVPVVAAVSLNPDGHPLYAKMTPVPGLARTAIAAWAAEMLTAVRSPPMVWPALAVSPTPAIVTMSSSSVRANRKTCPNSPGSTPSWATSKPASAVPITPSTSPSMAPATSALSPTVSTGGFRSTGFPAACALRRFSAKICIDIVRT